MQTFIQNHIASSGYAAIFVLAFLGAMCVPIPSELTFGFAGALSSSAFFTGSTSGDKHLHLWAVIVVGVVATVLGASVAYAVGRFGGRAFVDRWGKYVLLSHDDLDAAERRFARWGDGIVAVGQCVPVVRAFMGFGSGVAKVPVVRFVALTTLGAAVWVSVISVIGYEAAGSYHRVLKWFSGASIVILAVIVIVLIFAFFHRWRRYHEAEARRADGA
ncbi:MAG TPA: DedA family protein [Acidimicrobiales bacterium]|jgi:membrane protein DedA with SNARE-associated domain